MKYAIRSNTGFWWTGECWGSEDSREIFLGIDDLPATLDGANLELAIFSGQIEGTALDARYYPWDENEAVARVLEVTQ